MCGVCQVAARKLSTVSKVLIYQFLIITTAVFGFAVVLGWQQAGSAAVGGVVAFIPNAFFGWQMRNPAGKSAKILINRFYLGEAGKWALTVILFAAAFQLPNINIFPLLSTYMAAIAVFWFALLMR
ncbi:ATP synthase subunit I [Methylovulum psychrotolerans]|nr:ATP synthase subunit I [Methylovulum psychrotolerans]MBT9096544.1 ATP synthase subunit I [Methylovulum psychrotolerans]